MLSATNYQPAILALDDRSGVGWAASRYRMTRVRETRSSSQAQEMETADLVDGKNLQSTILQALICLRTSGQTAACTSLYLS